MKAGKECHYPIQRCTTSRHTKAIVARPLLPQVAEVARPRSLQLNLTHGSSNDKRAFAFYLSDVSGMLSGSFDADFWSRIFVQRSVAVPALWHSLVAISMLTELLSKKRLLGHVAQDYATIHNMAIQHYNRAIRLSSFSAHSKGLADVESLVINSLVFSFIEFILVDVSRAAMHLNSGRQLLTEWRGLNVESPSPRESIVTEFLIPIFDYSGNF